MSRFREVFPRAKTIIAVCHLPPLPDYPGSPGTGALVEHALADLAVLERAGVDGMLVENEHDRPHRVRAEPATVAAMTAVTTAACRAAKTVRVGCEILLNDPQASLDVAATSKAQFIRTDYFVDRMARPGYGEFDIDPAGLLAYRREIRAGKILILADIQVKYATMLEERSLEESARQACLHGADAVVVSGDETGDAPEARRLREARAGVARAGDAVPVLVGSGLDPVNARELLSECDGAIVGTALMEDGSIDAGRLDRLLDAVASVAA